MKDVIVSKTNDFKKFLDTVIESSFDLGVTYARKGAPFTKREAIKRVQDTVWNGIVDVIEKSEE